MGKAVVATRSSGNARRFVLARSGVGANQNTTSGCQSAQSRRRQCQRYQCQYFDTCSDPQSQHRDGLDGTSALQSGNEGGHASGSDFRQGDVIVRSARRAFT